MLWTKPRAKIYLSAWVEKRKIFFFLLIYIIAITNEYCRYGGILPYTAPANCWGSSGGLLFSKKKWRPWLLKTAEEIGCAGKRTKSSARQRFFLFRRGAAHAALPIPYGYSIARICSIRDCFFCLRIVHTDKISSIPNNTRMNRPISKTGNW